MTTWSLRRLSQIKDIIGLQSYLEVGVWRGETFLSVEAGRKTGVDPKFDFGYREHETSDTSFCEMTSDEFFQQEALGSTTMKFDVAFLDGLHQFEQTLRDFLNTVRYLNDSWAVLIDDTWPSDPVSAERYQSDPTKIRQRLGLTGYAWHGDVYKIVPFIHDFCSLFSYGTFSGPGNPQTLVWPQPRAVHPAI